MPANSASGYQVTGNNPNALFTLKIHRGDGMCLLAMNWKKGKPPVEFVGFAIEYKEPNGIKFFPLKNRLTFSGADLTDPNIKSTLLSPIQKYRWVHFPRNASMDGNFVYRITPVFMNTLGELSYGEFQEAAIELRRDTYPGKVNVAYTRGFVSSQAFVDNYQKNGESISTLLPSDADEGLTFTPTHHQKDQAYEWMGFEARKVILDLLDSAIKDKKAKVSVIAYDLNEPEIVSRLEQLGSRLRIIIDDDGAHGETGSGENQAATRLRKSTGSNSNVKRQHMGKLQHNKVIIVDGAKVNAVICGSTNFSWRGVYVQANNAVEIKGNKAVKVFSEAFENYWVNKNVAKDFGNTGSAVWNDLTIYGIDMKVSFSPHITSNALLQSIADDLSNNMKSSLFYSLAFLHQTPGVINNAINKATNDPAIFVYGMSDKKNGGIIIQKPDGNPAPVAPSALTDKTTPEPFKSEPTGGSGTRMHHKFLVIDFDKPTARVYMGSYNFSVAADKTNGENLMLIKDRRIAVSYMIEALRIFDHYHFRAKQNEADSKMEALELKKPPKNNTEKPWWDQYYTDNTRVRDRLLFA